MKAKVIKADESVIYKGEIYQYGDEFEIDESIGKSLIERGYIEGVTDNPNLFDEDEVEDSGTNLDKMSYPELKAYASKLGVSASGKREELQKRIEDYLHYMQEANQDDDLGDDSNNGSDDDLGDDSNDGPNTSMPE